MRICLFSARGYDRHSFAAANPDAAHQLHFLEPHLNADTAKLAEGFDVVCAFVNDNAGAPVLRQLHAQGTRLLALRSAGFNHVDLDEAARLGLTVVRVPAYSPHAVAEHAMALVLALNRKLVRANSRVHEGNFLLDGLLGFDLNGKTVGVVGTGAIGRVFARIAQGFGCQVIAHDPFPDAALALDFVPLDDLFRRADVISLHCPLMPATRHLISTTAIAHMKRGVMLINTSRGGLVDTRAVIVGLKSGHIGYLGLDVYEEESDLFFEDKSGAALQDDVFARLLTFPNVLITGHQAFFTATALDNIARTTLDNVTAFERGQPVNEVKRTTA